MEHCTVLDEGDAAPAPTFAQRRQGVNLKFRFTDDRLEYSTADAAGAGLDISLKYESINAAEPYVKAGRSGIFILGVVAPTAVITLLLLPSISSANSLLLSWAVMLMLLVAGGAIIVRFGALTSVRSTMFGLSHNAAGLRAIQVIKDGAHDAIVAELTARWRARLRELYLNPIDPETAKLEWLRRHGVITDEEFQVAIGAEPQAQLLGPDRSVN
jgi:hypothetical protein